MFKPNLLIITLGLTLIFSISHVGAVEIEYWQYTYKTRVEAIDKLISS
ncbi:uncharacterized protein METZ01_LOCUS192353, partial [marine metagenome]